MTQASELLPSQCRRPASPHGDARHVARYRVALAFALLCLGLVGCASTQTAVSRYALPLMPSPTVENQGEGAARTLTLDPIRITRYLNGEGIVMQLSDIEVQQARHHLWAETLSRQLERNLRYYLGQALQDTRVVHEAPRSGAVDALRVRLEVEDFQGRYDGKAVVAGQWQVRDGSGALISRQRFKVERSLEADGYPALVRSLAEAWRQVAADLATAIAQRS